MRYRLLEDLAPTHSVSFVDTAQCLDGSLGTVRGLASLIRDLGADTTVFVEADSELPLLVSQVRAKNGALPGRRVGIFLRSTGYVYGQPRQSFRTRLRRARRPSRWARDPRLFHRLLLPGSSCSTPRVASTRSSSQDTEPRTNGFLTCIERRRFRPRGSRKQASRVYLASRSSSLATPVDLSFSTSARLSDGAATTCSCESRWRRTAALSTVEKSTLRKRTVPKLDATGTCWQRGARSSRQAKPSSSRSPTHSLRPRAALSCLIATTTVRAA